MPSPGVSPGRSNSLQRMLELEKQCMFERLQQNIPPPSGPPALTSGHRKPSPPRPLPLPSNHSDVFSRQDIEQSPKVSRKVSGAPQLPPLKIDIPNTPLLPTGFPVEKETRGRKTTRSTVLVSEKDNLIPKVVSFDIPLKGKKLSQANSQPSKSELNELPNENKQPEMKNKSQDTMKTEAQGRKKRLSKAPPASSLNALKLASRNVSEAALPTTTEQKTQRKRSSSLLGLRISDNKPEDLEPQPRRRSRSRSGSFSNFLRSPFESRRLSIDKAPVPADSGFIGGIKLEIQKHEAYQQAMEAQIQASEADIHPALRKSRPHDSWTTPPTSSSPRSNGEYRQKYPPVTRQAQPLRPQSLVLPSDAPALGKVEKWRATMGMKSAGRHSATAADLQGLGIQSQAPPPYGYAIASSKPPTENHGSYTVSGLQNTPAGRNTSSVVRKQVNKDANTSKSSLNSPVPAVTGPPVETSSQSRSPPPPEPPRRSSKRHSAVISVTDYSSYLAQDHQNEPVPPLSDNTQMCGDYLDSLSHSASPQLPNSIQCTPKMSPQFHASSSDDSWSDQLHSPSFMSTPNTSRPTSEKDYSSCCGHSDTSFSLDGPSKSQGQADEWPFGAVESPAPLVLPANDSRKPLSLENTDDLSFDPIQAAAEEVLLAYSQIPVGPPSIRRHRRSEPGYQPNPNMPLRLTERRQVVKSLSEMRKEQPTVSDSPKELHLSLDPQTQSALSPASLLKPTRKVVSSPTTENTPASHTGPRRFPLVNNRGRRPAIITSESTPNLPRTLASGKKGPVAKIFVECCGCRFYHDMPSNLYEAMTKPDGFMSPEDRDEFAGSVSMTVKCPWCRHEMSTKCCAGLSATVHVTERLY